MTQPPADLLLSTIVFTDGAASGNPGPGGWAAILRSPDGEIFELGGPEPDTTNNRMELTGTIKALAHLRDKPGPVAIFTDSTYVIRGITQWIWGWRKRGWKTSTGTDVTNKDLWQKLYILTYDRTPKVSWRYVRGHAGFPGNERCDQIAVAHSKNRRVKYHRGPEASYGFDLTLVPPEAPLPEMRERKVKPKAHSYLSDLGGEVVRHDTWASCESRVKGRSGARFKKAKSPEDELNILKGWGLPASKLPS